MLTYAVGYAALFWLVVLNDLIARHAGMIVKVLLYMCSSHYYECVRILLYVSAYYYICVLNDLIARHAGMIVKVLLYVCAPQTTVYQYEDT
jgi:hypothetical protein